jgi:hypothetical protein
MLASARNGNRNTVLTRQTTTWTCAIEKSLWNALIGIAMELQLGASQLTAFFNGHDGL